MATKYAENWQAAYTAFTNIDFTSYDFYSIKNALIDYVRANFPENFNNYIENDHLIMLIETFAYLGELMAYRMDINANENFLTTAQRKDSILKLAKLVSYDVSRNTNFSGLLKIQSVITSNNIYDSRGINLANMQIVWNDPNNTNWQDQFFIIMNDAMTSQFGNPYKTGNIDNLNVNLYSFNNSSLKNNVLPINANVNQSAFPLEITSVDIDNNSQLFIERCPAISQNLSLAYINDNEGIAYNTGFFLLAKQGALQKISTVFANAIQNNVYSVNYQNVNNSDVWVVQTDSQDNALDIWTQTSNIYYNEETTDNIYEVQTLDNDVINLVFGDGTTATIPTGPFDIYARTSLNATMNITNSALSQLKIVIPYIDAYGYDQTLTIYASLAITLSASAASQTIDDIRNKIPGMYYTNNRMISGNDYNTFLKRQNNILDVHAVNRTFIGDSQFTDASGTYQNISMLNNDLTLLYYPYNNVRTTNISSQFLIDQFIEPLLLDSGIQNTIIMTQSSIIPSGNQMLLAQQHAQIMPRSFFYENIHDSVIFAAGYSTITLTEKSYIQGYIDDHYYGAPKSYTSTILINGVSQTLNTNFAIVDVVYNGNNIANFGKLYSISTLLAVPTSNFNITAPTYQPINNNLALDNSGLQSGINSTGTFGLVFIPFTMQTSSVIVSNITLNYTPDKQWWTIRCIVSLNSYQILEIIGEYAGNIGRFYYYPDSQNANITTSFFTMTTNSLSFNIGDTIVFQANTTTVLANYIFNSMGYWQIIPYSESVSTLTSKLYNPAWINSSPDNSNPNNPLPYTFDDQSWQILVSTSDNINWTIAYRNTDLLAYSENTTFWFNNYNQVIDTATNNIVYDSINIINIVDSNNVSRNYTFNVVGSDNLIHSTNNLSLVPKIDSNLSTTNSLVFNTPNSALDIFTNMTTNVNTAPFVYMQQMNDGSLIRCINPSQVEFDQTNVLNYNALADNNEANPYYRFLAIGGISASDNNNELDFIWRHYSSSANVINPSTNNIIDIYLLLNSYYGQFMLWLYYGGILPSLPTTNDLTQYEQITNQYKTTSDNVILHPATLIPCYGSLSTSQYSTQIYITVATNTGFSDVYIKQNAIAVIQNLEPNTFGQSSYFSTISNAILNNGQSYIIDVSIKPISGNTSNSFNCDINQILIPYLDNSSIIINRSKF